jgi:multidrug efflux pump subunit AcrA (membrane-fusion protein)
LAGTYAQVKLTLPANRPQLLVPVAAVRYSAKGVQVASVNAGTVSLHSVQLGRDYGKGVEVLTGLSEHTTVVLNPTDDSQADERVRVAGAPKPADPQVALADHWPAK